MGRIVRNDPQMKRRFTVRVKTGAHESSVTEEDAHTLVVSVREAPERGRANDACRRAIAEHFKVAPSRVQIIVGHTARTKIIEIW